MDESLFKVRPWEAGLIVVIGLLQAAALVAFTLLMRLVVGALVPTTVGAAAEAARHQSLVQVAWMAGLAVVLAVLRTCEFGLAERAGYGVVRRLRMAMYAHLQGMTPEQLRHRARGGLLLRFIGDLSMLRMWVSRGLLLGTVAMINIVAGMGVIMWINRWMGVAVLLAVALTGLISLMQGRFMRRATRTMRRRRSLVIGNLDEQINSIATVQVGGRTRGEYERLSRQNDALTRSLNRVAWLRGRLRGLALLGSLLITVLVLFVGLTELYAGAVSVEDVVVCLIVVRFLSRPLRVLGLAHDYWQRGRVSEQKIREFMVSASRGFDHPEREALRVRRGRVSFNDVTAGPLRGFTAKVEPGQVVAITGPSDTGKSTVLRVLARLQDPSSGDVEMDGQSLLEADERSVLRQVGYVSDELPLLRGSVRRNLTYHERGAELTEVQRVVFALGLEDRLAKHEHGLGGWLTEGGGNVGRGERQLIQLARAMIGNPPILLLDEPATGLDGESQSRVRDAIAHYQGTVFLVSHDPRDLALSDVVWEFAADGSHTVHDAHAFARSGGVR